MIEFSRTDRSRLGEWWLTVDRGLLTAFVALLTIGLLITPAASPGVAVRKGFAAFHFVERQIVFASLALLVLLAVSLARPAAIRRGAALLFAASVGAMIFVLMAGDEINGARRWIRIGSLSLQPSEFAKPAFVVLAAWAFAEAQRRSDVPALPIATALYATLVVVLVQQPDVGQTVLATLVWGALLFLSGQPLRWAAALAVIGVAGLGAAYATLDYVKARVERFLNPVPGDTSQVGRALQSFVEGGFFGRGPGEGTIKTALPDAHTDFVLAVVAEEYGVIACLVILGLFAFIAIRSIYRGLSASDASERLAVIGLSLMISAQALINMGVNVGLLPAKGMTLPFISAGGSSTIAMAIAGGVILALTRRQPHITRPEPMILPPSLRLDQPGHSISR
jgi:cell division protein FtsW